MSTYRRHDPKLRSATTARRLDILQTISWSPASSGPETTFLEKDISDIIAKAIATTLDDQEKQKKAKVDVKADF